MVVPLLAPIAQDPDPEICCRGVQLLVTVLNECSPSWTPQTLGIINTVSVHVLVYTSCNT